jgi:hypothetical protein
MRVTGQEGGATSTAAARFFLDDLVDTTASYRGNGGRG